MIAEELEKARLWCLDNDRWSVNFQFNPSSLSFDRNSKIDQDGGFDGAYGGPPTWETGNYDSLSFTVLVDTSVGGEIALADAMAFEIAMLSAMRSIFGSPNNDSVLPLIHDFYRLTLPVSPDGNQANERPPVVAFVWDEFEFMGFVTSFNCDFKLFDHWGRAKRAELQIKMDGRAFSGGLTLENFMANPYKPKPTSSASNTRDTNRFDLLDLA